jgi:hypothetical protein
MGMTDAAIFGAEDIVGPCLVRRKPEVGLEPGDAILLYPEGGDKEAVDNVLGGQYELDRLPEGDAQDVALHPVLILEEP